MKRVFFSNVNVTAEGTISDNETSEIKCETNKNILENSMTYPKLPSNISDDIAENMSVVYRNTLAKIESQWKQTVFDTEAVWKRKVYELKDLLKMADQNSKLAVIEKERLHEEKQNLLELQRKIMAEEEKRSAEAKQIRSEYVTLQNQSKSTDEKGNSKSQKIKAKVSKITKQSFSILKEDYITQEAKLIDCLAALKLIAGDESTLIYAKDKNTSNDQQKEILQENIANDNKRKKKNEKRFHEINIPNESFIDQIIKAALKNAQKLAIIPLRRRSTISSHSPLAHVHNTSDPTSLGSTCKSINETFVHGQDINTAVLSPVRQVIIKDDDDDDDDNIQRD